MLARLLELKNDIQEISKQDDCFHLTVNEWNEIETIKKSLEPCQRASVRLQGEQCTLRDLCKIWAPCVLEQKKSVLNYLYFNSCFNF